MIGLGTIINSGAIILGGIIGLIFGKIISERFQKIVTVAMGLSVFAMSVSGFVSKMLVITDGGVETAGTFMMIFSLVLGAVSGEAIDLDRRLESFGGWLKRKTGSSGDTTFVDGFMNASLTVCIGAMAVIGALTDGLSGDYSILLTKSVLDFVMVIVMTSSMGKGCIFSAIPVAVLQGTVTLGARLISPIMNTAATNNLSLVGSVLIMCVGVNLVADGKFRIKVANLLPAIVFAVAAAYIPFLN